MYVPRPTSADIIKAELEEKQFKVKLCVIDTPGFGDYVNNRDSWMPIIDFIVGPSELMEEGANRMAACGRSV